MSKPRLLVVEDDDVLCTQLQYALRDEYVLAFAQNRQGATAQLADFRPHLVTLDLGLPPTPDTATEGLAALEEILRSAPSTKVVVLTGSGDRRNAMRAVELGAFDYYVKPIDLNELRIILRRAAHIQGLEQDSDAKLRNEVEAAQFEEILGNTPAMRQVFAVIQRVARTDATVLVEGESGTGKEMIARAIHRRSRRRQAPFIAINCGAIPETLLEAELFGHERGAFTGAHVQRKGKLELANHGTLFLDEIAELGLPLQVKLLRFLQERTVERIGGRESIPLDLRIIAATNRDLKTQLRHGLFREDLYYRLSVVTIWLPPLRERREDILLLAHALLRRASHEHRRRVQFSSAALQAMTTYRWPGNIRELENKINRAVIMARSRLIEPADLDLEEPSPATPVSLKEAKERTEREKLIEALGRHCGNISRAARDLRVSRPTLHGLLEKHGLQARLFRSPSHDER